MPILDTLMTFDSSASANAVFSLTAFCDELSRRSGREVRFHGFGGMGSSSLQQGRIELHAQNQPAREVLRHMLGQVGATVKWCLLYDPDSSSFALLLR
jgi:hypothetical protein